tara:strand:+ start:245 stop:802 length:558 start_codon:yes stop_codon:yes gene_type:complete
MKYKQKLQMEQETWRQECMWHGCEDEGVFPAPREPGCGASSGYNYFCKEHIRQVNKHWDYFAGKSQQEIEAFERDSLSGHRPLGRMGQYHFMVDAADILEEAMHDFAGFEKMHHRAHAWDDADTSYDQRYALKVMKLSLPVTAQEIKQQYKQLAKLCHPDIHGPDSEEKFKELNKAYEVLKGLNL